MRHFVKKSIVIIALGEVFLLNDHIALATQYQAVVLQPLTPGGGGISPYFFDDISQPDFDGQVVGGHSSSSRQDQATLWNSTEPAVDLTPTGLTHIFDSGVNATDGVDQVGFGGVSTGGFHALFWSGTGSSAVDIGPPSLFFSTANGVGGNQIVGYGYASLQDLFEHALLWNGPNTNPIDLNPTLLPGVTASVAVGTNGVNQVGYSLYGIELSNGQAVLHAILWSGSAASAIDLNPATCFASGAYAIAGTQEVGIGEPLGSTGVSHAFLWNGTAESAVDLNPTDLSTSLADSIAVGTNGIFQVGCGYNQSNSIASETSALVWSGTAESAVDLQQLLPSNLVGSIAISVDAAGNVYGIAQDKALNEYSVEWVAVPEPTTGLLCGLSGLGLFARRRRA
jgi:hypothetical protein